MPRNPTIRASFNPQRVAGLPDKLVIFDGECVLCSAWVRFVLSRDSGGHFRFASIQGKIGADVACRLNIDPAAPETNAVIIDGMAYFKSDSALAVLDFLPGWRWAKILRVVPRALRDWLYDRIARNRYRLFGRTEHCIVPSEEQSARFLYSPLH